MASSNRRPRSIRSVILYGKINFSYQHLLILALSEKTSKPNEPFYRAGSFARERTYPMVPH